MLNKSDVSTFDVIIVGAGPAGCACALALRDAGLQVALLEKETFPRDKVCGDAIPGRAIKTLQDIDPAYAGAFRNFPLKYETKSTALFYKQHQLTFDWVLEAYTCTRMEFDNFLFTLVQENTHTAVFTGAQPAAIAHDGQSVVVTTGKGQKRLKARLLIGADGAHSAVARGLAPRSMDRKHHVGSVRAYFSNVSNVRADTIEVYFDKRFLPSYLWVFPVPGNRANVGFGMLSSEIARRRINLKTAFYEFIRQTPALQEKFNTATQAGALQGFGLPLGSGTGTISGNNFMLTGDAASLIDPISGDGIGNAMLSGRLAALQAAKCFQQQNFTGSFMKEYDAALLGTIGRELRTRYYSQRILSKMPVLLDAVFLAGKNKLLRSIIRKAL